jgi:hypothetical protein
LQIKAKGQNITTIKLRDFLKQLRYWNMNETRKKNKT